MNAGRGILVAAPGSGIGKTSLVCGLLAALRSRGVPVRTAKCGPDYLDPMWLSLASGSDCPNLDPWMAGPDGVRELARGESTLIVETAMGLYDGIRPDSDEGSGAEVASILGIPVLLVVDASGSARTVAALVRGLRDFGDMPIAGVVANRVGNARHAEMVAEALESSGLPPLVGYLVKDAFPSFSDRHLGLVPPSDGRGEAILEAMGRVVAETVDLDRILALCVPLIEPPRRKPSAWSGHGLRLGLSWDEGFRFAYGPVIADLEERGVDVVRFSPLHDQALPDGLDGLWICGGYPELHAKTLAENRTMRESVVTFCASGAPVLAECGGLLYLARELVDHAGDTHPMCGVVPAVGHMRKHLQRLGYRTARARQDLFVASEGASLRGHEFHYGELDGIPEGAWQPAFEMDGGRGAVGPEGWWNGNVLATWFHAWLAGNDAALEGWIGAMRAHRARMGG